MDLDEVAEDDASELVRMPDPNADKANAHRGKPLENLLMGKNRKLQDELTSLRVSSCSIVSSRFEPLLTSHLQVAHEELFATHRTITADLEALHSRFDEQRTLNDRLENDLLRINQSGGGSGAVTPSAREDPLSGLNLGKKVSSPSMPLEMRAQLTIIHL